uniref:receptor protein-tyrosine kinase n=1 Tax=Leptinotarsa decemlineata TaxID=7539 RepID=A0A0U3TW67_LEPDE|nr:Alk [Leptinotarsa decemlineata]
MMLALQSFLPFALLFILCNTPSQCQDEKEKSKEKTGNINAIYSAHTIRELNQDIRPFSNTDIDDDQKDIFNPEYYHTRIRYYFRPRRSVPERSIASIRKRLNAERKREEELMSADALPKMEPNDTIISKQVEQEYNKQIDKIKQLHKQYTLEKHTEYETGVDCDFENDCLWTWRKDVANGFFITSGGKYGVNETGPRMDADQREGGGFLLLRLPLKSTEFHVDSPLFSPTISSCKLALWIYQEAMEGGDIRIVGARIDDNTQWFIKSIPGDNSKRWWHKYEMSVGKISKNFTIIIEVVAGENMRNRATVAFDNIKLFHCYHKNDDSCSLNQYKCKATKNCLNSTSICDITKDCLHGDDEQQSCGEHLTITQWKYRHKFAIKHLKIIVLDEMPFGSRCNFEEDWCGWQNTDIKVIEWARHNGSTPTNFTGPNFDHTYKNTTGNYLYVNMLKENAKFATAAILRSVDFNPPPKVHGNSSSRFFNSCAVRSFYLHKTGKHNSAILVQVTELKPSENVSVELLWSYSDHGDQWVRQVFILPNISHRWVLHLNHFRYFIHFEARRGIRYMSDVAIDDVSLSPECFGLNIPKEDLNGYNYWDVREGHESEKEIHKDFLNKTCKHLTTCNAKGRFGPTQPECTKAYNGTNVNIKVVHEPGVTGVQKWVVPKDGYYTLRTVVDLKKGREIYMLVGQEGTSSCVKVLEFKKIPPVTPTIISEMEFVEFFILLSKTVEEEVVVERTFSHLQRNGTKEKVPLAVAGGGGGLGLGRFIVDNVQQHGQGISKSRKPHTGKMYGPGAGGGWTMFPGLVDSAHKPMMGSSLQAGGIGGKACYNSTDHRVNSTNGEGGYSFLNFSKVVSQLSEVYSGYNSGPGYVIIIPEIDGCDCDYKCVALDAQRSEVSCICPAKWMLKDDKKTCRYQQRASGIMRRKMLSGADFQLDRLRLASDSMMTEYNPNYEFGGVVYTLKDLNDIPRDQLRLVRFRALGQGAFGEVYQGFYRQRPCDTVEMPVAVKTLPEMSTSQAEMDFLMEALIMSKFNHPNIVHFIGVCFNKHPRFIVLELLSGGDLKNFLRESRPKPVRSSPLTRKDLVMIAVDVAKGCKYLEDNRFIHRDIAARNCLLTTKGPGRCIKIADFGMSRDVYRWSDYYRKGGKAMLPIKWMPPEAFQDGIFTSKTDVWSYGVLLWEIMSMGYMPYTGCANKDVMDLVTTGGRLDPPSNCPGAIYGIMTQCWHPTPELRPSFGTILERLGYCIQDPDVMNAPLPVFHRPPSYEKDMTVMRPKSTEENCLQVKPATLLPTSSDYLIPNHTHPTTPDQIESTSSIEKLLPDNSDNWETSFIMPHSRSTQPLLMENNKEDEGAVSVSLFILPNSTVTNHNNNLRNECTLKSGVSLDAGALAKQAMAPPQNKKYANINTGDEVTSNGILQNDPFSNHIGGSQKSEINC